MTAERRPFPGGGARARALACLLDPNGTRKEKCCCRVTANSKARGLEARARRPVLGPRQATPPSHRATRFMNSDKPAGNEVPLDRGRTGDERRHDLVLLVDHDPAARARAAAALAARCWRVIEAGGGTEA